MDFLIILTVGLISFGLACVVGRGIKAVNRALVKMGLLILLILLTPAIADAKGYAKCCGAHYVKPYVAKKGAVVQGHMSGDPHSGIHFKKVK